jgi:hypothetical protein
MSVLFLCLLHRIDSNCGIGQSSYWKSNQLFVLFVISEVNCEEREPESTSIIRNKIFFYSALVYWCPPTRAGMAHSLP